MLVLVESELSEDAVKGPAQLLAQRDGGAAELVRQLVPGPAEGALLGEIALVRAQPAAHLLKDFPGRRLLARIGRLVEDALGILGDRGVAAQVATLGMVVVGLVRQLVS